MKQTITIIILILYSFNLHSQDVRPTIEKINDKIDLLVANNQKDDSVIEKIFGLPLFDSSEKNPLIEFKKFLKTLSKQEEIENTFAGELGFGLDVTDSNENDLIKINTSASIKKGNFPDEFNFSSNLSVELRNGKFIENVTKLTMAYDHHFGKKLDYEGYAFIKRTSNNFLNIDQRYEAGAGIVWNAILTGKKYTNDSKDNRLTEKGVREFDSLTVLKKYADKFSDKTEIIKCLDNACTITKLITKKEQKKFTESYDRVAKAISKRESRVRASLLTGLNYEIERTKDSLNLVFNDSIRKQSFDSRNLIRLVVAPNIELKINELTLQSRCYFKLKVLEASSKDIVQSEINNLVQDTRSDFRLEWENKATLKMNEKVSITATLNHVYINAPRRGYYNLNEFNPDITEETNTLFRADNRFVNFFLGFKLKL